MDQPYHGCLPNNWAANLRTLWLLVPAAIGCAKWSQPSQSYGKTEVAEPSALFRTQSTCVMPSPPGTRKKVHAPWPYVALPFPCDARASPSWRLGLFPGKTWCGNCGPWRRKNNQVQPSSRVLFGALGCPGLCYKSRIRYQDKRSTSWPNRHLAKVRSGKGGKFGSLTMGHR